MTRLNIILLLILMICALGLISSQHQTRKLFIELQKEQEREKQLNVEWGQLQLEQSTWATHARVENIATRALGMQLPELKKVRTVALENDHATIISSPEIKGVQP
jgi:cell division protein FtsL